MHIAHLTSSAVAEIPAGEPARRQHSNAAVRPLWSNSLYMTHIYMYTILQIYKTIANTHYQHLRVWVQMLRLSNSLFNVFTSIFGNNAYIYMYTCDLANFLNAIHNPESLFHEFMYIIYCSSMYMYMYSVHVYTLQCFGT